MNVQTNQALLEQMKKDHPKASEADLQQLANAKAASNTAAVLKGVPNADDVKFNDAVAEKGKKIILTSVRQGAELTREVFLFIRACQGIDYVEGTFKVAEARAIKAIRDGQPEGEKIIKTLGDIAKIQGGAGASSYISVRTRLSKILRDSEELIEKLQKWYNFQHKVDKEPQMFVHPEFLDPWSKKYEDDKRGWSQFTRDARLAEQCGAQYDQRVQALERAKGKEASSQTGQNGDQHQQGMVSGTRQRGNLADSTQKCLNAVVSLTHEVADELPMEQVNGILSTCVMALQHALAVYRAEIKAKVAETSSRPSQGIADAENGGSADAVASGQTDDTDDAESGAQTGIGGEFVRPEWLRQEDWDAANDEERHIMMDDKEAYLEELRLMERGEDQKDAESNEPSPEKPAEAKEA